MHFIQCERNSILDRYESWRNCKLWRLSMHLDGHAVWKEGHRRLFWIFMLNHVSIRVIRRRRKSLFRNSFRSSFWKRSSEVYSYIIYFIAWSVNLSFMTLLCVCSRLLNLPEWLLYWHGSMVRSSIQQEYALVTDIRNDYILGNPNTVRV